MTLPISFLIGPASNLPAGYTLRRIREWGDPVMVAQGNYDIDLRGGVPTFQVIEVWIPEVATWGAVKNFNRLTAADIYQIARAQLVAFGVGDWDPLTDQNRLLSDGFTLKQKMGWLYQPNWEPGTPPGLTLWGAGEWWEPGDKYYGTMLSGGEFIAASNMVFTFNCILPGDKVKRDRFMRRVYPFHRADLGKDPRRYPWLWQQASCVYAGNRTSRATPKGIIHLPVALNPSEFKFSGADPQAYYVPVDWLTAP